MIQNKQYQIDLWLFIASIATFVYILFMMVAYKYQWNHVVLGAVMELITIPILLMGVLVPVFVTFRFIAKKTENRRLAMFTITSSILTAILIGYAEYSTL